LIRKAVVKFSGGRYSSYVVDDLWDGVCVSFVFDGHVYFVRLIENATKGWSISAGRSQKEIENCWLAWFHEKYLFTVVDYIVECLEYIL
jgi:hypothetical protein